MGWESENIKDPLAPTRYKYNPKWSKDVDYNPDRHRSESPLFIDEDKIKKTQRVVINVPYEGALVIREKFNAVTQKYEPAVCAIYTKDDIQFDSTQGDISK